MILEIIAIALGVTAVIAIAKHGSVAAALASAKAEAANLETLATTLEGDVKTKLTAIIARIRAL